MGPTPSVSKNLKICYLITRSDSIGGAQLHTLDLAQYFGNTGHEVHIICGGEGPFVERVKEAGIGCTPLKILVPEIHPVKDFQATRQLLRVLSAMRPSLIHAHSSKAGVMGRWIGKKLDIPTVFTAHGWSFAAGVPPIRRRLYRFLEWWAARWPGLIITLSESDRAYGRNQGVAPEHKMVVVNNGIANRPAPDRSHRKGIACPNLIMVARFERQKDQHTLIQALSQLRDLPWKMLFVGDGPLQHQCQQTAEQLRLSDRIEFLGFRRDVESLLESSDVFVLSTNWEGLPLSIMEAMRSAMPVVATDVDGVGEEVVDGQTGFLVPRADVDSLAGKLRRLLENPSLMTEFGINGRKRFEDRFQLERMGELTLQVYLSLCKK
jgi:glycosyltransferase involved in cell wall biosynthesis